MPEKYIPPFQRKKPEKIPMNVINKDFFKYLLLVMFAWLKLMIFKDNTGNTQGIKLSINPPKNAKKIIPKFSVGFSISKILL